MSLAFTASINIGQALLEIAAELRSKEALQLVIEALNYQNQISSQNDIVITYEDVKLPPHMHSLPSVSYTPLDVYKSQAILRIDKAYFITIGL